MILINGLDVSKYQGTIDFKKVKAAGYNFVFIRLGWSNYDGTITTGLDPYFKTNVTNAIAAGMNVGVYLYSYANTTNAATIAARSVGNLIKGYKLSMPVVFDYEDANTYAKLGKQSNTNICKTFLSKIKELGYFPMLYTYKSFANSYLTMSQLSDYDFWLAQYASKATYTGPYTIWQYSSSGTVNGISGRVDLNYAYKDYPTIILGGGTTVSEENLSILRYRVKIEKKCQGFGSKNVNDVVKVNGSDYLPFGDYKILSKENSPSVGGFLWAEIRLPSGNSCYVVYGLADERAEIVTVQEETNTGNNQALQSAIDEIKSTITTMQSSIKANTAAISTFQNQVNALQTWAKSFK